MWRLRKWLIKKLAGRQTIVLNARIVYSSISMPEEDIDIAVKGHHEKYIVKNTEIVNVLGKTVSYGD